MPEIENTPVTEDPGPAPVRSPLKVLAFIFGLAALVLAADQLSKMWAQSALVVGHAPKSLIGELIQLRLIYNSGAALSIASGMTWVLTLLSAGVVVFIVLMARKIASTAWAVALGLVLGGALGNLLDRLFRAPGFPNGHVVDFIDYGPFIGNVADIAIVGAAVLIAVLAFIGIGPDGKRQSDADAGSKTTTAEAAEPEAAEPTTAEPTTTNPESSES
ncbi:signal peptidase II [Sanguibacter gelidistatuariae]|uniref:Lipoprotein signal peptidase n=1 Tax=Sanguibacter gelidistatuariae TaxID=1814289 RepID=A0A1G6NYF8_9MICO|nr:signal peptidase II [Sanguibacter gelidistatuariae]SDC73060.1 signal peptidase II [Sanguibacter gelidistatuariae]